MGAPQRGVSRSDCVFFVAQGDPRWGPDTCYGFGSPNTNTEFPSG